MKAIFLGGPKDGLEIEVDEPKSTISMPIIPRRNIEEFSSGEVTTAIYQIWKIVDGVPYYKYKE